MIDFIMEFTYDLAIISGVIMFLAVIAIGASTGQVGADNKRYRDMFSKIDKGEMTFDELDEADQEEYIKRFGEERTISFEERVRLKDEAIEMKNKK